MPAPVIYRAREAMTVWVESLGRDVRLDPAKELSTEFPDDKAVIDEWAARGLVRTSTVEQATAAPGEQRSTRRPKTAA